MADSIGPAAVQMYFENAYCINCWYKDLDQPFIKYPPFVIHYAGCQMCTGRPPFVCASIAQCSCQSCHVMTYPSSRACNVGPSLLQMSL